MEGILAPECRPRPKERRELGFSHFKFRPASQPAGGRESEKEREKAAVQIKERRTPHRAPHPPELPSYLHTDTAAASYSFTSLHFLLPGPASERASLRESAGADQGEADATQGTPSARAPIISPHRHRRLPAAREQDATAIAGRNDPLPWRRPSSPCDGLQRHRPSSLPISKGRWWCD